MAVAQAADMVVAVDTVAVADMAVAAQTAVDIGMFHKRGRTYSPPAHPHRS